MRGTLARDGAAGLVAVGLLVTGCSAAGGDSTTDRPLASSRSDAASGPASASPTAALTSRRDWSKPADPGGCDSVGVKVRHAYFHDLTGDARPEAVVVSACDAGAGSPPSNVFVFDGASPASGPRLLAHLVRSEDNLLVSALRLKGSDIRGDAYGYSSESVPRCCPDLRIRLHWHWNGSGFIDMAGR